MHSAALDSSGSPRKRTTSRGMSEDESLRSIIKETESSTRRLPRSDSRTGTLRKRTDSQQSDQDLFMGLPEMLELQANYEEAVQELRGLEVEREALLFQVDVLQDTLEGVEELLAEAQREAGQASLELEREREEKRKLESLVCSLMKEVEKLREERNNQPTARVSIIDEATKESVSDKQNGEKDSLLCEPCSTKLNNGGLLVQENGGPDKESGDFLTKPRRMVGQLLAHLPSLALDNVVSTDGVLQRPYENHKDDGRDPSPDDSDKSAYEDASAETPDLERTFPGDGDLPEDAEDKEKCPADGSQTRDPTNPDGCILS